MRALPARPEVPLDAPLLRPFPGRRALAGGACRASPRPKRPHRHLRHHRAPTTSGYGFAPCADSRRGRLAAGACSFENAYSSGAADGPVPLDHPHRQVPDGERRPRQRPLRPGPGAAHLAEILKERGYRTGAAIGGFPLLAKYGLGQGFEFYDDRLTPTFESALTSPRKRDPFALRGAAGARA
jgi:hypothetical protein